MKPIRPVHHLIRMTVSADPDSRTQLRYSDAMFFSLRFPVPFPSRKERKAVKACFIMAQHTEIACFIVDFICEIHITSTSANGHSLFCIFISVFHGEPPVGIFARRIFSINSILMWPKGMARHLYLPSFYQLDIYLHFQSGYDLIIFDYFIY